MAPWNTVLERVAAIDQPSTDDAENTSRLTGRHTFARNRLTPVPEETMQERILRGYASSLSGERIFHSRSCTLIKVLILCLLTKLSESTRLCAQQRWDVRRGPIRVQLKSAGYERPREPPSPSVVEMFLAEKS